MLYKWSEKEGDNATYGKLTESFKQCGRQDIVDEIKRLMTGGTGKSMLSFNLQKLTVGIHTQKETYCYSCFETPVKGLSLLCNQMQQAELHNIKYSASHAFADCQYAFDFSYKEYCGNYKNWQPKYGVYTFFVHVIMMQDDKWPGMQ